MNYYMGIDMGGTMAKAGIYTSSGEEIAISKHKLTVLCPGKDMLERDVSEVREAVYEIVKDVLGSSGVKGSEICGIGVTGQGNGLYMFDEKGNPVGNGILSSDNRAKEYVTKYTGDGTWERLLPKIHVQLWPGEVAMLLAWFADHNPEMMEKVSVVTTAKEYVRYLLTGVFAMEISEASGTACMDQGTWTIDEDILEAFGIAKYRGLFPEKILGSTEIGGYVTEECAQMTGLAEGIPVVGGQFDVGACALSIGITEEKQLGIIVGSWGINGILSRKHLATKNIFEVVWYPVPEMFYVFEGSSTSATNLEWFIENFTEDFEGNDIYGQINRMVQEADYRDSVIFLPFLYGSNVGVYAKSAFIGLEARHGKKEMLRAIYEGVAFCHRYHIENLRPYMESADVVRMAGGATKSPVWMQIFSDVLNMPLEISESEELGTMGVALEAAVGTGEFASVKEAAESWVRIAGVYQPDPERAAYYEKKYAIYKRIIEAMSPIWEEIDRLKDAPEAAK